MYEVILKFTAHIVPFMDVLSKVVVIWGFFNFINQLKLQNLTVVADRALRRLPDLKSLILQLKNCDEHDIDTIDMVLDKINEVMKFLYMDLRQLRIAKQYHMDVRIVLLSDHNKDRPAVRQHYLQYEFGNDWDMKHKAIITMQVAFIQKLEDQLFNIFDLSHEDERFANHLSTNIIRAVWISLIIYLLKIECVMYAFFVLALGLFVFSMQYIQNKSIKF